MIRTERLIIRPLNYYELVSRVYGYSGMIQDDEMQGNFIKYSLIPMKDAPEKDKIWYTSWIGFFEGEEVLECGFLCPPTVHNVVEVFCYTKSEYQKRGFGTEAIKGLIRFATAFDNIKYVCASANKENINSQKMLQKAGLQYLIDNNDMKVYNLQIKS